MRKVLYTILATLLFSGGAAFAQASWAGVSLGWPLLQGYYGMEDALGNDLDLRGRLAIQPLGGIGFAVGADALYDAATLDDEGNFLLYVGGGPSIGTLVGGFGFDVTGLAGVEYALEDTSTTIFGETRLGIGYSSEIGIFPSYGAALGVNFYFN